MTKVQRQFIASRATASMIASIIAPKDIKVFKMNDYDWVAHYSEEAAKHYYHDLTGVSMEDIEEDFIGDDTGSWMYWDKDEVDKR